ncbi:MAG: hypothetical protein M2R45_01418 [Verrucomicrobia subdivision 3 bacterium]|nr:hypothetical protein [Limisphaerales bacterium]MCS1415967.1 hypothetical protein [Limisphaerales bacterium]
MKLLRAEFLNFRMLRDLELTFSSKPDRKLTVIRAANESGKTTILHGLQWAFYGDPALPGKGEGFRLHPIDWKAGEGNRVEITVTVDFELTSYRRASGQMREARQRYRLVRSTSEELDSRSRRSGSTVKLYKLNDSGASSFGAPEAFVNDELPPELREVFFTDGDRALSFIEANAAVSDKRQRVQRAIRSLLGLGVIDDAIKHVHKSAMEVNKKAKQVGGDGELNAIATDLDDMEDKREELEAQLEDANQQFRAFDESVNKIDRKIDAALQKGDKEKLRKAINDTKENIKQLDTQLEAANKEHSELFGSRSIATDLLAPVFADAFERLGELHEQGKIPSTTIPVLHECLDAEVCVCGEALRAGDPGSDKRRAHIHKLIDDNRRADEIQEIITELYYGAKELQGEGDTGSSAWLNEYTKVVERHDDLQELRERTGREFRKLEKDLESLPDTDIQGLRETRRQYKARRDSYLSKKSVAETRLERLRKDQDEMEAQRDRFLREQKKGTRILAESQVTQDVKKVLQRAYERITHEELQKVSELMNNIFLEMIGADPDQGAIIQRTEISSEFDIIVYGPNGRTLNPDRDLNGASRRALTLAFILALTKVSEVEAPNVIDTPLGMTSGFVKRSILRSAVRESAQLILFLTHDEIAGCEEIIDENAGVVFTLTNPAHYPKMLVNDPGVVERKVLRCTCDHHKDCQLCQRRFDMETDLDVAS